MMKMKKNNRMKRISATLLFTVLLMTGVFSAYAEAPMIVSEPVASELVSADDTAYSDEQAEPVYEYAEETITETEPTAAPTAVPMPTEIPMETESPYKVDFILPNGWTNAAKTSVTVVITDSTSLGFMNAEYNTGNGWKNFSANSEVSIPVAENTTLTVRLTDPHGHEFTEETEIGFFDRTAPDVQARIESECLHIVSNDDISGIAGVQVNGLLFTTIENGVLDIRIADVLNKYEHLAIRAFDYAGNFSDPVTLDNPYYKPESTSTAKPVSTPKAQTTDAFESISTPEPYRFIDEPFTSVTETATPQIVYVEPAATPTPVIQTEYVTIGPGMPFLSEGNSHTLDCLYSAATNKQFLSIQTKSGNVFYLVIDYDKPIDEENELYETYFLNLVDERDLLALMDDEEAPTPTPQIVYVTPEPTNVPVATPTPAPVEADTPEPEEKNKAGGVAALVVLALLAGGAIFYFVKNKKKGSSSRPSNPYAFDEDDDEGDENSNE